MKHRHETSSASYTNEAEDKGPQKCSRFYFAEVNVINSRKDSLIIEKLAGLEVKQSLQVKNNF